jgi:hypothetical protein
MNFGIPNSWDRYITLGVIMGSSFLDPNIKVINPPGIIGEVL